MNNSNEQNKDLSVIQKQGALVGHCLAILQEADIKEIEELQWYDRAVRGSLVLAMRRASIPDKSIAEALKALPWAFMILEYGEMEEYYRNFTTKMLSKGESDNSPRRDLYD